ncbi:MAG: serine hydrolase, partial [Acidobacteria bacterium]|nr:serine hydrolase [Acidobacteriota bacterium]
MDRFTLRHWWILIGLLAALPAFSAAPESQDLDQWMERALVEFHVPGAALGIVKDGKLVFARGYGVRQLGQSAKVDQYTLFGIASNSKAFTAAALGILATDGKLAFDDPVGKHLPAFQLHDPYVTREITVRDLLCHRGGLGLGAGDLLIWPDTDFTRDQVVAALRFVRPATSFRSKYAYNNLMFVVAGQVVAAVSGMSWDDFIRTRIFAPLEMKESRVTSLSFRAGENVASPHSPGWRPQGELKVVVPTRDDTWAAAAGVKSNIVDLARWVAAQLREGETEAGQRLWSPAVARDMWSAQTIVPIRDMPAGLKATQPHFSAYGLGWMLRDYRGRKLVSHSGALSGMLTSVVLAPEEKLGVIVLTNQENGGILNAVTYHVLDSYLNAPFTDWIREY